MGAPGGDQEVEGVPPPAPAPRLRSRLRRALRASVVLAVVLFLTAILGLALLHTPPGLAAVRALAESWGSRAAGGTLRLGQLELALWQGRAAATAVSLHLPGSRIEAQRVELDWSPVSGPQLSVLRPSVVVTESGEPESRRPATGLAAQPWRVLERLVQAEGVQRGKPWPKERVLYLAE